MSRGRFTEQPADMGRQFARRRQFVGHHVRVELRRAPDRLTGVVDKEVEPSMAGHHVPAEGLDARDVSKIQPDDLEPIAPVAEVGLLRVAQRSIAREPGSDNQPRTRTQQLQPRLVPDLHPSAGQQSDAPTQVGQLGPRGKVRRPARRTQLIVEGVDLGVGLLADVTHALDLGPLAEPGMRLLEPRRRRIRRGDKRPAAVGADPGLVEHGFLVQHALGLRGLAAPPVRRGISGRQCGNRAMQALAFLGREGIKASPVGGHLLEPIDRGLSRGQYVIRRHSIQRSRKRRDVAPHRWRGPSAGASDLSTVRFLQKSPTGGFRG